MKVLLKQLLVGKQDIALVGAVIFILTILFVPVSAGLLDFLLIVNFSVALLVLLITFLTDSPLNFSTFPSLLLITTLFRLALNVSATRLILNGGSAGHVIGAVGAYVVGGNYVIGLVVFLILVVVQYVVVTSGAQRVAEVAARFTLDSMPGKQMSIDADMNMGLIDEVEARRRRALIEREANFYGAMDGATKFVKGDAIAGIIILLIDIIGGLSIGMLQHGMPWTEAVHRYTLLTVGDGIVTQIPSLVIAVATGIIITRAASDAELGGQIAKQVLSNPRTLLVVGITLFMLLLLPGLPFFPVLVVLAGIVGLIYMTRRGDDALADAAMEIKDTAAKDAEEDFYKTLQIDPLEIRLGSAVSAVFRERSTELNERVQGLRRQFVLDYGFVLPPVMTRELAAGSGSEQQYQVFLHGNRIGQGELYFNAVLAINPGGQRPRLEGRETRDPAYGLPAQWVSPDIRQFARGAGYTLVDTDTVLITHLNELIKRHAAELLTRGEVERLALRLKERQASLVDELIPAVLTYSDVQKVLQILLRELVSIRQLETIFEVLVDAGKGTKVAEDLAERVRERLGAGICQKASNDQGELHVLTLAPEFERSMLQAARQRDNHALVLPDASQLDGFLSSLAKQSDAMLSKSLMPVLLCPSLLRRHVRGLIQRSLPHITVIGINELPTTAIVRAFGTVTPATA
ncbi:flagellar biosynthesis protein FlhA [Dyella silvatica]|uniref:flagellar biosynthesis protein FlhA n=1 Tax=Dyella silvatica TaxID=2992128 RepID=UPI00224CCB5D|nr:flagellar biosynthesis protein FlhA [Dyella silvatica]